MISLLKRCLSYHNRICERYVWWHTQINRYFKTYIQSILYWTPVVHFHGCLEFRFLPKLTFCSIMIGLTMPCVLQSRLVCCQWTVIHTVIKTVFYMCYNVKINMIRRLNYFTEGYLMSITVNLCGKKTNYTCTNITGISIKPLVVDECVYI